MIDWDRVSELRSEVGPEDFPEVVELFLEEVEEAIAHLSFDQGMSRYSEGIHFLKGCALNLGFQAFSQSCLRAEDAIGEGATPISPEELGEVFSQSRVAFLSQLPGTA